MKPNPAKKQLDVPEESDRRCIWMTAGVISYKLCPFKFDCEDCEFDAAMRQMQGPTRPNKSGPPIRSQA